MEVKGLKGEPDTWDPEKVKGVFPHLLFLQCRLIGNGPATRQEYYCEFNREDNVDEIARRVFEIPDDVKVQDVKTHLRYQQGLKIWVVSPKFLIRPAFEILKFISAYKDGSGHWDEYEEGIAMACDTITEFVEQVFGRDEFGYFC